MAGMLNVRHQRFRPWHLSENSTLAIAEKRWTTALSELLISSRVLKEMMVPGSYQDSMQNNTNSACSYLCITLIILFSNRYGSWAVCFTYGTWFGVKGLTAAGWTFRNSPAIRKACEFLLSKQLPCGGWGESYLSSQNQVIPVIFFTISTMDIPVILFTIAMCLSNQISIICELWLTFAVVLLGFLI